MSTTNPVTKFLHDAYVLGRDRPYAIVTQGLFALFLLVAVIAYFFDETPRTSSLAMYISLCLLSIATTLAFLGGRVGQWRFFIAAIAGLDFVALGLARYGSLPEGGALSVLSFLPAMWLVLTYKARGLAAAVLLVIATVTVPTMLSGSFQVDFAQLIVVGMVPISMLLVGTLVLSIDSRLNAALNAQERLATMSRHTSELLHSTLNNIDVAVNLIDDDGETIVRNDAAARLIAAYAGDTEHADALLELVSIDGYFPDGVTPYTSEQSPIRRAMRGETSRDQVILLGDPAGEQKAFSVSAYPLRGDGLLQGHVMIVAADVSPMQQLLRQRDDFVATVSHELRTPLTSILGYVDLAIDDSESLAQRVDTASHDELKQLVLGGELVDYLNVVQRNAEQLLSLVEDLLLEQQARRGQLHVSRREFELVAFTHRIMESLRPAAAMRQTKLRLAAPDSITLYADKQRIAQVLDNLISNAIKYGEDSGLTEVELASDTNGVTILVRDHGQGMPPDELAQLFTPFMRGKQAMESAQGGTGLGLSITDRIVKAHGGTIRATSEVGVGTTMTVWLPHATKEATA